MGRQNSLAASRRKEGRGKLLIILLLLECGSVVVSAIFYILPIFLGIHNNPVSASLYYWLFSPIFLLIVAEAMCLFGIWKWSRFAVYAWFIVYAAQALHVLLGTAHV